MATLITRKEHDELPKLVGVPGPYSYLAQYRALVDAWEPMMRRFANMKCMDIDPIDGPCGFTCPPCRARKLMEEWAI